MWLQKWYGHGRSSRCGCNGPGLSMLAWLSFSGYMLQLPWGILYNILCTAKFLLISLVGKQNVANGKAKCCYWFFVIDLFLSRGACGIFGITYNLDNFIGDVGSCCCIPAVVLYCVGKQQVVV